MRAVLLGILLLISCSSGCLEVPIESCEDTDCFPFNNDLLNELLSNPNSLDVLLLASENSRLRVNLQQLTKRKLSAGRNTLERCER